MNAPANLLDIIDYRDPHATGLTAPNRQFNTRRLAVRAVATGREGRVYLLNVTAEGGYIKLPGGGVEPGEDLLDALRREVLEEIGYEIEPGAPIGRIIEFDDQESYLQESLCYHAVVTGGSGRPNYTEEELADGFSPIIHSSLEDAIRAVESLSPTAGHIHSIRRRELAFLEAARHDRPA